MKSNGLEIELKFLLEEPVEVFIKRLNVNPERIYQKTVMFDNSDGLMQETNGRVRLRQNGEITTLSYKRPLPSETVKREIEWETRVDSWQVGEELLKAMGFSETTSYEKYRTSFHFDGSKIEVDEYPFANFVEIEGDDAGVKEVAKRIGFDLSKALTKPCDTLFTEWRISMGLPMKSHMLFRDYDK